MTTSFVAESQPAQQLRRMADDCRDTMPDTAARLVKRADELDLQLHGKPYTYRRLRCRCEVCRQADSAYRRKLRAAHQRPPLVVPHPSLSPRPCKGADPETFFPRPSQSGAAAKRICGTCAIRAACLERALDTHQRHGIWGGTTPNERRALSRGLAEHAVDAWLAAQAVAA